jgi:hypothetical protein
MTRAPLDMPKRKFQAIPHRSAFLVPVLLVAVVAGCRGAIPDGESTTPNGVTTTAGQQLERQRQQAHDALARWADAVSAAGSAQGFAIVGEATGQIGDWELAVGSNNKLALLAGKVEADVTLSDETPPLAHVHWNDGSVQTLPTISAAQALTDLQAAGGQACPGCDALEVTGATLSTVQIETSRGLATVPAWEFSLNGTAVRITRIAIADSANVSVSPPPWDPNDPPVGLSISWAFGHVDGKELMVGFVGDTCGTEYTAEAVESTSALVVIIVEHANSTGGGCRLVGRDRTTTAQLAAPLGHRAVLEVREGLPVPVTLAP